MTDAILEKLFGGAATVKTLKFFLFNQETALTHEEITDRVKENPEWAKNAIDYLQKLGFLKRGRAVRDLVVKKGGKRKTTRVRKTVWMLHPNFPLTDALNQFFHRTNILPSKDIVTKLSQTGTLKLVSISGMFLEDTEARLDLIVVADNMKKAAVEKAVGLIEAKLGREIRYAAFETPEFLYRYGMYDKLIRDVFDYKHDKILNKLAIFAE